MRAAVFLLGYEPVLFLLLITRPRLSCFHRHTTDPGSDEYCKKVMGKTNIGDDPKFANAGISSE